MDTATHKRLLEPGPLARGAVFGGRCGPMGSSDGRGVFIEVPNRGNPLVPVVACLRLLHRIVRLIRVRRAYEIRDLEERIDRPCPV